MRPIFRPVLACLLGITLAVQVTPAAAQPSAAADAQAQATPRLPLRARLDKDAIRNAIAGLEGESDPYPRRHEADTLSATPAETFSKNFAEARVPDCLHPDGLKRQPTFFLGGLLALPFVAVAKVRGVCR